MSYKTILVHMPDAARAATLTRAAFTAASIAAGETGGAHIRALSVVPPTIIVPDMEGGGGAVISDHRDAYFAEIAIMREKFESETSGLTGITRDWATLDCDEDNPFGLAAGLVVSRCRTADLVVAAQDNPDWQLSSHLDVAEQIVMESGRPVLLMPRNDTGRPIGERILVAWNGTREAARAAFDALPFLRAAKAVHVVWIEPEAQRRTSGDLPGADLCETLARHGVSCEASTAPGSDRGAGQALLAAAQANGADMMVMGCYGHSRLREMILGGASREVFLATRLPVLLTH